MQIQLFHSYPLGNNAIRITCHRCALRAHLSILVFYLRTKNRLVTDYPGNLVNDIALNRSSNGTKCHTSRRRYHYVSYFHISGSFFILVFII